jgi:hypothetical protein
MGEKPARVFYAIISYLNPHWIVNTTV